MHSSWWLALLMVIPLIGALGPELAAAYADLHVAHGVDLRLGVEYDQLVLTQH